jgi:hypothetical protein
VRFDCARATEYEVSRAISQGLEQSLNPDSTV